MLYLTKICAFIALSAIPVFGTESLKLSDSNLSVMNIYQRVFSDTEDIEGIRAWCMPNNSDAPVDDMRTNYMDWIQKQDAKIYSTEINSACTIFPFSVGNDFVGFIELSHIYTDAYNLGIFTFKPFRNQSLGTHMMAYFMKNIAPQLKLPIIWKCYTTNSASNKLALSSGFTRLGENNVISCYQWSPKTNDIHQ